MAGTPERAPFPKERLPGPVFLLAGRRCKDDSAPYPQPRNTAVVPAAPSGYGAARFHRPEREPRFMTLCPCGSGKAFDACCAPYLAGLPAPTAVALMRSRYAAFAKADTAYLAATMAPEIREDFDADEITSTAADTLWQGMEIRATTAGAETDDTGTVEFVARYRVRNQQQVHHELATFRREDGRWLYADGQLDPKGPPRKVTKIGRNDPCPCGSGKKNKKCCGR